MSIKVVVLYPYPKDQEAFEKAYTSEHIPLVAKSLTRLTKATYSHVLMSPQGNSPFCRIAELHYASLEDLQADNSTPEAQALSAQAAAISTGGLPIALICDEETVTFEKSQEVDEKISS
jgi:uncharacterized protein (TIGR02118 family)